MYVLGCECGDGWFVPIEKLVGKIHLLNRFCKDENLQIVCSQLKEKHGEFTCYFHVESAVDHEPFDRKVAAAVSEMVDDFMLVCERECWNVCEICGAGNNHYYNGALGQTYL